MFLSSYNADYRQPTDRATFSMLEDWIDSAVAADEEQDDDICTF